MKTRIALLALFLTVLAYPLAAQERPSDALVVLNARSFFGPTDTQQNLDFLVPLSPWVRERVDRCIIAERDTWAEKFQVPLTEQELTASLEMSCRRKLERIDRYRHYQCADYTLDIRSLPAAMRPPFQ